MLSDLKHIITGSYDMSILIVEYSFANFWKLEFILTLGTLQPYETYDIHNSSEVWYIEYMIRR